MKRTKKLSRKPAPPADNRGLTRTCLCPCKKKFKVKFISSSRKFYGAGCQYRWRKWRVEAGLDPPDLFPTCRICGKTYACWSLWDKCRKQRICNNPKCRKEARVRGLGNARKTKTTKYSEKKIQDIRENYCACDDITGRPQCLHYVECLSPVIYGAPIFIKYFETEGACREHPKNHVEKLKWTR